MFALANSSQEFVDLTPADTGFQTRNSERVYLFIYSPWRSFKTGHPGSYGASSTLFNLLTSPVSHKLFLVRHHEVGLNALFLTKGSRQNKEIGEHPYEKKSFVSHTLYWDSVIGHCFSLNIN